MAEDGNEMPKWKKLYAGALNFFDEKGIEFDERFLHSRLHRTAHFWLLVCKSFARNRCPVRAASLAYTTLLALVPLLAVGVSITTSMLQKRGEEPVNELIGKLVDYVAPALDLETRPEETPVAIDPNATPAIAPNNATPAVAGTNVTANAAPGLTGRGKVVKQITGFIANIKSGTIGITGTLALLFVAISLLRTIEATFNDIWGVTRGRGWFKSIVYYWTVITLGPVCLVGAFTLTTGPHLERTRAWLDQVPFLGSVMFHVLPFVILGLGFAAFYALMPNTKVQLPAALIGGFLAGSLWQLNNLFNVIYVSRVVSYTSIYGGLAVIPLLLLGMYFSWLIMLLGAQIAYAWQNRESYLQEKQAESVNQRGREFIALRLMTHIAQNFTRGARALSGVELSRQLTVPSALTQKILACLVRSALLVEVTDTETRFSPARPLDRITAFHVVSALRGSNGNELETTSDEARPLVRAEFERILLAEREAGDAITMQSLAELTAKKIGDGQRAVVAARIAESPTKS